MSSRRLSALAPLNSGLCAAVVVAYLFSTAALLASQSRQARLTGSVADANGAAWLGAVVRVRRLGVSAPVELRADRNGRFSLGVEPGVYRVVLGAQEGFRPDVHDEIVVAEGAVVRVEGRVRAAQQFEYGGGQAMAAGDGDLRIRVTDAAGHPIGAAQIVISSPGGPAREPRLTDAMGQLWTVIPEGRYTLTAAVPGFETRIVSPVGIAAGSVTEAGVTLELAAKYRGRR